MTARECPYCLAVVPAGKVAASSDEIECPGCRRALEVAPLSRHLAIAAGLAAGAAAWHLKPGSVGALGWVLPLVCAFLAVSVVAPLVLMLTADLRPKALEPTQATGATADVEETHGRPDH